MEQFISSDNPPLEVQQLPAQERESNRPCCKPRDNKGIKWLEDSSLSSIAFVFTKSNSWIMHIFWLVVLLTALGGFGYSTYDRVATLVSKPTSTSISFNIEESLTFPAVTICSLNFIREDKTCDVFPYKCQKLSEVVNIGYINVSQCKAAASVLAASNTFNEGWGNLVYRTGSSISEIMPTHLPVRNDICKFFGENCNYQDFDTTITAGGLCYTFNGRPPYRTAQNTGARHGLRVTLDSNADQHYGSFYSDNGMKVIIHEPSEPARPDAEGISVPPGFSVYIAMNKVRTIDETKYSTQQCRGKNDNKNFNMLREYPYSSSACLNDCFYTTLADKCGCTEPLLYTPHNLRYKQMRHCNLTDICCEKEAFFTLREPCKCPPACEFTTYSLTVSYSKSTRSSFDGIELSEVNVFYKTLSVEVRTTSDSYTVFGLIADIGGNAGLFLGFGILAIVELGMWITAEVKRCCGKCRKKNATHQRM